MDVGGGEVEGTGGLMARGLAQFFEFVAGYFGVGGGVGVVGEGGAVASEAVGVVVVFGVGIVVHRCLS